MTAPDYGHRWPDYARNWDGMVINRVSTANSVAIRLVASKDRYRVVEAATGVPWALIAVIHERESSQDWHASLAQGDPWNKVSTHVPKGRGPFRNWESAAIDALHLDGLDKVIDWRLEKVLYHLEAYNGWGYYGHGVPSPYVWAGSNQYARGKYTSDGHWSPTTVDQQLGCAPMLKKMMEADSSIVFERET